MSYLLILQITQNPDEQGFKLPLRNEFPKDNANT